MLSRNRESNKVGWLFYLALICIIGVAIYGGRNHLKNELRKFATIDKSEIETIVKEYIDQHPQDIIASVENMRKKDMEEMQKKAKEAIHNMQDQLQGKGQDVVLFAGNKDGDVVVTTFLDYNCGYCKRVNSVIKELVAKDSKVKVIFKELPVLGPGSQKLAQMAIAVYLADNSQYMNFHNALMEAKNIDDKSISAILTSLKLDEKKINELMNDAKVQKTLEETANLAEQLNIRGTPAFVIGEDFIPGAVDINTLTDKVNSARNKDGNANDKKQ